MWTSAEIRSKLVLNQINQETLAKECGITPPQLSTILTKTPLVLPKLVEILGANPFDLSEEEIEKLKNEDKQTTKNESRKTNHEKRITK